MGDNNVVHLEIIEFDGPNAVLKSNDSGVFELKWPIRNLPADIKKGDNIIFKIMSHDIAENEHELVARKLLEEMIN